MTLRASLVPSAAEQIAAAITAAGGAVPFSEFMQLSLYGTGGFYSQHGRAGRRGDFITSPEVGPLFGAVVARALDAWWRELGAPSRFDVIEVGAGPGTLARSVLSAAPACSVALRYTAVEVSTSQRAMHPSGVESRAAMPAESITGVILANELLDNLPFSLFVFDDSWKEAFVSIGDHGAFVELLRTPVSVPRCLPMTASHGSRVPVQRAATEWVSTTLKQIERGRLIVLDYCTTTTAELATRAWREWLRTFRQHERGGHYLLEPGAQDITCQVVIDQLATPTAVSSQAEFLDHWGIRELVEQGRAYWSKHNTAPDLVAMTMRSRVSEAEALCDSASLGSFSVLQWVK